jgi:hypothetical protein
MLSICMAQPIWDHSLLVRFDSIVKVFQWIPEHWTILCVISMPESTLTLDSLEPVFITDWSSYWGSGWLPWDQVASCPTGRLCTNGCSKATAQVPLQMLGLQKLLLPGIGGIRDEMVTDWQCYSDPAWKSFIFLSSDSLLYVISTCASDSSQMQLWSECWHVVRSAKFWTWMIHCTTALWHGHWLPCYWRPLIIAGAFSEMFKVKVLVLSIIGWFWASEYFWGVLPLLWLTASCWFCSN